MVNQILVRKQFMKLMMSDAVAEFLVKFEHFKVGGAILKQSDILIQLFVL